ncbi:IclR family transcriptional regulator [Micromonospora olivasterospora]|uniref:IclR family transcriptional regulator n=2 Tax=Micromonospora olivasterospora TaxID=1880 RepID=A0A562IK66_MICOL|nr:IclR family transcriptional regulator [Micromonospora olivasterospora]
MHLDATTATTYRVVNTLIETGYAQLNGYRQGYTATLKVMGLGAQMPGAFDLREAARKAFRPVGMRFGETITVARLDGLSAVFIDKIRAGDSLVFYCDVGRSLPLHIGAAARCMMAHLTDEEFEALLANDLPRRTNATINSPEALRAARAQIRQDGYALSVDEVDVGVSAIAVPLLGPTRNLLGAVAIANTSSAWSPSDHADRIEAMIAASRRVFGATTPGAAAV